MEPDYEALDEFRRIFRNLLVNCLGRTLPAVDKWIVDEFLESGTLPMFYNNPPAFYAAREFIPVSLRGRLLPTKYIELWDDVFMCLESRGHWNDFSDTATCRAVSDEIREIVNSAASAGRAEAPG